MFMQRSNPGDLMTGIAFDASFTSADEDLLCRVGFFLKDKLHREDRERLLAMLVRALWSASVQPVVATFVLERLALPLDEAQQFTAGRFIAENASRAVRGCDQ
jgi:hypothetical protein